MELGSSIGMRAMTLERRLKTREAQAVGTAAAIPAAGTQAVAIPEVAADTPAAVTRVVATPEAAGATLAEATPAAVEVPMEDRKRRRTKGFCS